MNIRPVMFRPIFRTQQWNTTGYVCLCCRKRLASTPQHRHSQARLESTSTATASVENDHESWFGNFNELSETTSKVFHTGLKTQKAKETVKLKGEAERKVNDGTLSRKRRQDRIAQQSKKLDSVRTSDGLDEADRTRQESISTDQGRNEKIEHFKDALDSTIDRGLDGDLDSIHTATRTMSELPSDARQKQNAVQKIIHPKKGPHRPRREKKAVGETAGGEEVQMQTMGPESASLPVEKLSDGEMRSAFEDIVSKLPAAIEDFRAKSTQDLTRSVTSVEKLTGSQQHTKETQIVDDVGVPSGRVSERLTASLEPKSPHGRDEKPRSVLSASNTFPSARTFSFSKPRKEVSLAAKVQEATDRLAKWGGFSNTSAPLAGRTASFDTLREADQVSPKPIITTAGETTAWGSEPIAFQSGFGDSPADLAEKTIATASAATPDRDAERNLSSFSSRSIDLLKRNLAVHVNDRKAVDEVPGPGENKVTTSNTSHTPSKDVQAGEGGLFTHTVATTDPSNSAPEDLATLSTRNTRDKVKVSCPGRRFSNSEGEAINDVSSGLPELQDHAAEYTAEAKGNDASERLASLYKARQIDQGAGVLATASGEKPAKSEQPTKSRKPTKSQGPSKSQKPAVSRTPDGQRRVSRRTGHTLTPRHQEDALSREKTGNTQARVPTKGGIRRSPRARKGSFGASNGNGAVASGAPEPSSAEPMPAAVVEDGDIKSVSPGELMITSLNIEQPAVPGLEYGLDRVLFNPGVYQLQDPHSRVYNFDPYLQRIMPVVEFDFNALKEYKTSSQDTMLSALAREHGKKYVGSTSSMTSTLGHFHYLLSNFRPVNMNMLSRAFPDQLATFTNLNRAPNAMFLRWKDGTYAIDADKEFDGANVLMMLGKSMEKLMTLPKSEYERYRKSDPRQISETERSEPETFHYTTMNDFLMRSQLDAHDSRLPGTGMFDLKTRAVVSVRMDLADYEPMTGYQIHTLQGRFESYEREYYDMMRSTMLKYMLQARMGCMDGIFVAYHNVDRIFGFQYLPMSELDRAMHGQINGCLGDQEFRMSLRLFNEVLEMATKQFPEKSLRFHFETQPTSPAHMLIFGEPMEEDEIEKIQSKSRSKVADFERTMMGIEKDVAVTENSASPDGLAPLSLSEEATVGGDPQSTVKASEYPATDSGAEPHVIQSTEPPPSANLRPLFAATILLYNYVNGEHCDDNRPHNLKRDDEWRVTYVLKEPPMSLEQKWARYEDMKRQRKTVLAEFGEEDEEAEGAGEQKKENSYIKYLRSLSVKGRKFRGKVDEIEAKRERVVVGRPVVEAGRDTAKTQASVKNVVESM